MRLATVGIVLVGASSLLCNAGSVSAGLVTWEFAGELTGIHDTDDSLGDLFAVGMPFSGQYAFDPTTPDASPLDPDFGNYEGAVNALQGKIGDIPFVDAAHFDGEVIVFDNVGGAFDSYSVNVTIVFLDELAGFSFTLGDPTAEVFSDDAIPLIPPDFDAFDSMSFMIEFEPDGDALFGKLTSLTPEPGTVTLLALGSLALCRRRCCR